MRIRSVKPEYWSAEDIGLLSRDARLLYIATWNVADDEGLLEWSARRLKVSVFPYDDDLGPDDVRELMDELVAAGFVHTYAQATVKRALRGKAKQPMLGWIVMFPHHQKPNRPQPTRLEPPPLDDPEVLLAYAYRDKWTCHRCKNPINDSGDAGDDGPALDDVEGITAPGFPSSIRAAHVRCATRQSRIHRDLSVQPQLDVDVPVEVAPTGTGPVLSVVPAPPVSHEPASVSGGFQGRRAAVGGSVSEVPARHSAQGSDDSESGPVRFSDTRFSEHSSPERRGEEGEGRGSNLTSPGIFRHPLTDDATNNTPAAPARSSSSTATDGAVDDPDFPTPDFPTPDFPTPDFPTPGGVEKSATSVSVTDKTTGTPQSRGRPKIEVDPQTAEFLDEICEIISRSAEEATGRPTPPTDRWRTEVERLLRVDGRAPGQVRAVVDWMSGHGFWRTQITTGRHLRTHFPDLFGNDQFAQWTIKQNLPDDDRPAKARGRRISRTGKASP